MKPVILVAMLASVPGIAVAQWNWNDENPAEGVQAPPAEGAQAQQQGQAADPQTATSGQWVYTQQYGWSWMPYGDAYTAVPANGEGEPYEYAYTQSNGWTWLAAPWIWGYGPWPLFGAYGPGHFGWYGHGWWRTPGRWSLRAGGTRGVGAHGFVVQGRSLGGGHFAGGHFGGGSRTGGARFAGGGRFGGRGHSGGGGRGGGGHRGGGHGGGGRR